MDPLLEALQVKGVVAPTETLEKGIILVLGFGACQSPSLVVEVLDQVAVLIAFRGESVGAAQKLNRRNDIVTLFDPGDPVQQLVYHSFCKFSLGC